MSVEAMVRNLRSGIAVSALLGLLLMIGGVERALGHAGEVHTEPAPTTRPATPEGGGGSGPAANGKAAGSVVPTDEPGTAASAQAEQGASAPAPPIEPDTDPTLHFVALGAILLVGAGFLLLRRRRALA